MPGVPGTSSSSDDGIMDKFFKDENGTVVTKQMIMGGVAGWLTGYLSMKVGKLAATAIGGGLILLQVANHQGYIKINWNRINKDVEKVSEQIQKEAGKKQDWADKLEKKLDKTISKGESLMKGQNIKARRWYQKFVYGEDYRVRQTEIFLFAFAAGAGLGIITGK